MSTTPKKRAVVSYENMSEELAAAFAEKYPKGYSDYFQDLVKYDKPDGTNFYAVTVELRISSVGLTAKMEMTMTEMRARDFLTTTSLSTQLTMTQQTQNNFN